MDQKYDVVLCVGAKDVFIVQKNIECIYKYLTPLKVYIISNSSYRIFFKSILIRYKDVHFVDENELFTNLSSEELFAFIKKNKKHLLPKKGWYFQQFLKMAFARSIYSKDYYLIWDADTIPVNKIFFFDNEKVLLCKKNEYHSPYFDIMAKLLPFSKLANYSFIAEHMMINSSYMKELLELIESNKNIPGNLFWKKVINAIPPETLLGFSEFETFGTFLLYRHPDSFIIRELRTNREAGQIYGRNITMKKVCKISNYDTISLEPSDKPCFYKQFMQLPNRILIKLISIYIK